MLSLACFFESDAMWCHGANGGLVAVQQETDALTPMTAAIVAHPRHHDRRAVVPAHGVERNQNWG